MAKRVRILVVDDSAFMRKAITMMLEEEPTFEIVGTARDGNEAIEAVHQLKPDVITLDIEMPGKNGLEVLTEIMRDRPTPVIMISSLSKEGADITLKALEIGAVDFIPKELSYVSLDIVKIKDDLIAKIKNISKRRRTILKNIGKKARPLSILKMTPDSVGTFVKVIAIGISTGGPPALQKVIPRLPKNFPKPIVIVQHMPPQFTRSLAGRLDGMSELGVKEAEEGDLVKPGMVYIAPGGRHMTFRRNGASIRTHISDYPGDSLHRPSVNVMFNSVVDIYGGSALGVIMTGMGKDGLEGSKLIKRRRGLILAESEESCVVYGMPKAVIDSGIVDKIAPADKIADEIVNFVKRR